MSNSGIHTGSLGVPDSPLPRVIIAGAGFGGLKAAKVLKNKAFQVVIIDKNNYHQFQPLFYQVAMSGLEPSSVVFPLRKVFHGAKNIHFRTAEIQSLDVQRNILITSGGEISYDYLLLSMGAKTHYFSNNNLEDNSIGMKSVSESLYLRNQVLQMLEDSVAGIQSQNTIDIVVVGGGPTGVELAGSLAEMKKMMFPRDYPEMNFDTMKITLVEGSERILSALHPKSSDRAEKYLKKLGVEVILNARATKVENHVLILDNGKEIPHGLMIWAAGITPNPIAGLPAESIAKNGRILTDAYLKVRGTSNIYCIGDQAWNEELQYPKGHPQVAQPAIQGGDLFSKNLLRSLKKQEPKPFHYKDLGSMATVGRNLAVAEIFGLKLGGFIAWVIWMAVHLMSIVGVKNRLIIFINWLWNYITYDQSLRLLIKPFLKNKNQTNEKV
ncbi:MAG: NAD(P)/FAD-dependent oxidoreductase [Bacteroidetes bacterium]|nr:NAD(P)/FAD-dependent oxidoreductase [Bacteroidota bacterium]